MRCLTCQLNKRLVKEPSWLHCGFRQLCKKRTGDDEYACVDEDMCHIRHYCTKKDAAGCRCLLLKGCSTHLCHGWYCPTFPRQQLVCACACVYIQECRQLLSYRIAVKRGTCIANVVALTLILYMKPISRLMPTRHLKFFWLPSFRVVLSHKQLTSILPIHSLVASRKSTYLHDASKNSVISIMKI